MIAGGAVAAPKGCTMKFVKMNGAGNDYVYFDLMGEYLAHEEELIRAIPRVSDRHFGVGGDGVVFLMPSRVADVRMRMFNLDGSEGKMCGNALRCIGKLAYERGYVKSTSLTVETASGIKTLDLFVEDDVCVGASAGMGKAYFAADEVPIDTAKLPAGFAPVATEACGDVYTDIPLSSGGKSWSGVAVSMGNPHIVIFTDENVDTLNLEKYGAPLETDPLFPDKTNVEFVNVVSPTELKMRVWERGSGETLACGTGSCATVSAAVAKGICRAGDEVSVVLRGGVLKVTYNADGVTMSGGAEINFTGDVTI